MNPVKLVRFLLPLLVCPVCWADPIDVEQARANVVHFLNADTRRMRVRQGRTSGGLRLIHTRINPTDHQPIFYFFQEEGKEGFILASADDATQPVLAYSDEGTLDLGCLPCCAQYMFDRYAEQIVQARKSSGTVLRNRPMTVQPTIDPLLLCAWKQRSPYNSLCPIDDEAGERCVTGCMAVAVGQMMYYHRWPECGTGSHSYTWNGRTLCADFEATVYDWDAMARGDVEAPNSTATLLYHVGVAVETDYGAGGSGAYAKDVVCLTDFFGYEDSIRSLNRNDTELADWENIIYQELAEGRPVLYSAVAEEGSGHAFVCDGYENGYFHMNLGWGGASNGYYALDAINTTDGGIYHLNQKQQIFYGIQPHAGMSAQKTRTIDHITYALDKTRNEVIVCGGPTTGYIVIPDSVEFQGLNYPVTTIPPGTFMNHRDLTSVSIPNTVTTIGNDAFRNCDHLASVNIPELVSTLNRSTFLGCSNLSRVCLNSDAIVATPPAYARNLFGEQVTEYLIGERVTEIGDAFFWRCNSLTSVVIPRNVRKIGKQAFQECEGLTSVVIEDGVEELGQYIFYNCVNLSDIYCYSAQTPQAENAAFYDIDDTAILHVPFASIDEYRSQSPWNWFERIESIEPVYVITYMVDDELYCQRLYVAGSNIIPENLPKKDGYTFSGWSEVPEKMPAHDVEVTGSFSINSYTLTYMVDGEEYKTSTIVYGAELTAETEPTKEGHTFSGWSEIPEKMPAHDVEVTGSFSINSYTLTYMVDGEEYKTSTIVYGAELTVETEPTKEGHTFSGWSEIPEKMPAHDVEVTGSYSINSYTLTYKVDGEEYKTSTVVYGAELTAETEPTKEGYTFCGWSEIPEKMPAHDVEVTGSFSVNKYTVTFKYGEEVLSTATVNYGEEIPLPESLDSDRYTLVEWLDVPATMPSHDITIQANFTDGISSVGIEQQTNEPQYYDLSGCKLTKLSKGINIVNGKKVLVK